MVEIHSETDESRSILLHAKSVREAQMLSEICAVYDMLCEKNRAYGDSALAPVRIFSHSDKAEQIRVRIDDKLSRIRNDPYALNEDALFDLIGYLFLLLVALHDDGEDQEEQP